MVEYRTATAADARVVAAALRAADAAELVAVHGPGLDVVQLLEQALALTPEAQVAVIDSRPAAVFGCSPGPLFGVPWLLGTDACDKAGREFVRAGRAAVALWRGQHKMLTNMVDARHAASIRWLRRIGFEIRPAVRWGAAGLPFHPFVMCT